jgi:hypothetical protein
MSSPTRAQLNTLSTLRFILRHIRTSWAHTPAAQILPPSPSSPAARAGASDFTRYVMSAYREGASVRDRARVKALRAAGDEYAAYLRAVSAQDALMSAYKGVDPDLPLQREATARYVGLTMPDVAPSAAADSGEKYRATVAARLATADVASKFTGVDNMKAQYFGAERVLEERRKKSS